MIQKNIFNDIINHYDLNKIGQHLVFSFIENKKLDYSESPILSTYFKGFFRDQKLYFDISALYISDLKELENYIELLIPKDDRKVNGAFFTPTYIVNFIIKMVTPTE